MKLHTCDCCGLIQRLPDVAAGFMLVCVRCHARLPQPVKPGNQLSGSLAAAGLLFYIPAIFCPMLMIERLGHRREDSLVSGIISLWTEGYWLVGGIVMLCSVVLPLFKLVMLLWLSLPSMPGLRHRAFIYRLIQLIGRWGMLDVMLIAILLAFIRLENIVNITAGPGVIAFTVLVIFSLLSGMTFNSRQMWRSPS